MSCLYPDYIEVINTNKDPHKEVSVLDSNIKIRMFLTKICTQKNGLDICS